MDDAGQVFLPRLAGETVSFWQMISFHVPSARSIRFGSSPKPTNNPSTFWFDGEFMAVNRYSLGTPLASQSSASLQFASLCYFLLVFVRIVLTYPRSSPLLERWNLPPTLFGSSTLGVKVFAVWLMVRFRGAKQTCVRIGVNVREVQGYACRSWGFYGIWCLNATQAASWLSLSRCGGVLINRGLIA